MTAASAFGPYRLLRLLGQGGTATVHLAQPSDAAAPLTVLKRLRPELAHEPRWLRQLAGEGQLGLALRHPSIVRVHALDEVDGEPFLALEYVDGLTLRELLERGAAAGVLLTPSLALFIAARLADALGYAHALTDGAGQPLQLVHCDVNPTNVMLSRAGEVKLLDFGVARTLGPTTPGPSDTGEHGLPVGTLRYMSPEQARGMAVDSRSDQFSLGIVLYECLTGQRLFLGDDEWQTIRLICESNVAAPSRLRPGLGAGVDEVVRTLLARDPAARYATTAAAVDALRRLAPGDDEGAAELRAFIAQLAQLAQPDAAPTTPSPSAVVTLDEQAPRGRLARAAARVSPLLLFALWLGLFGALFPGDPSPSLRHLRRRPRPAVAVLLPANRSGRADDDWLALPAQEALAIALGQSERLHVIDGDRVARAQLDLGLWPEPLLPPRDAARIGRDLDADLVVTGAFARDADPTRLRLSWRVQETQRGATRVVVDEAGSDGELLALVARGATRLRAALGERIDSPARAEASERALLPANSEAARAYAEGLAGLRAGDFARGRQRLTAAVALDPDNARAHLVLARLLASIGYDAAGRAEADRAFALGQRLPREMRLVVAAERDRLARRWREAIDRYQLLFELFPDNLEYGLALMRAQWDGAAPKDAQETVRALLRLPGPNGQDPRLELAHAVVANGLGDRAESDRAAEEALKRARARGSELQIADAQLLQSQAAWKDCAWATERARAAEATFARLGDPRDAVACRQVIGMCLQRQGDSAGALAAFDENIARTLAIGDRLNLSTALGDSATALNELGRSAEAAARFERSLEIRRQLDQPWPLGDALVNLTTLELTQGRVRSASQHIEEAVPVARRSGDPVLLLDTLLVRQRVLRTQGDALASEKDHAEREKLAATLEPGAYADDGEDILDDSYLWEARGKLDEAIRSAGAARARFSARADGHATAVAGLRLAALALARGRRGDAEAGVREVLAHVEAGDADADVRCAAHELLARIRLAERSAAAAQREVARARAEAPREPTFALSAALASTEAGILAAQGRVAAALARLRQLVERCHAAGDVALELDARLAEIELLAARAGQSRSDARRPAELLRDEAQRRGFVAIAQRAARLAQTDD